ncbi:MAG: hypothetical protein MN733_32725 [Nitrososphaera sp.]|nr:hypothetical protein [Nitrososphaera sp.]
MVTQVSNNSAIKSTLAGNLPADDKLSAVIPLLDEQQLRDFLGLILRAIVLKHKQLDEDQYVTDHLEYVEHGNATPTELADVRLHLHSMARGVAQCRVQSGPASHRAWAKAWMGTRDLAMTTTKEPLAAVQDLYSLPSKELVRILDILFSED